MYKIAVLGDRDSIYGFAALGLDTYPVDDQETGAATLKRLADSEYAVIYVTESLQNLLMTEIDKYRTLRLPAIIPIPGVSGNTGRGVKALKKMVEQAVGSDIIFNNEN
ncbi:V-type ATP synthase subunit F [Parasporobacterium paucivorans]|uniref:V/A-type H+-transporting ATPase subunit F n=1 Tax=Parasporobacterium paucivorans DSM 15970 TaxID=1122934 RepID=A0A1M6CR53_9FIRM|nr:V-type ATP synthase subunit F [Parasporobacterium paucivorans]SHI63274.1 V/A-type H+-transporting ATPase subunit F [Parasporobacterium paucivorans DSM 15970]